MRRMLDYLILMVSSVLGLVALRGEAAASSPPYYGYSPRSGAANDVPLVGGLAALGFYWLWRRLRRRDQQQD